MCTNINLFGLFFPGMQPILILEATFFVIMLTLLNIVGVRESSRFNELLGALDAVSESAILFFGFLFAFNPTMLMYSCLEPVRSVGNVPAGEPSLSGEPECLSLQDTISNRCNKNQKENRPKVPLCPYPKKDSHSSLSPRRG
jgi:hypothetical protein